MDNSIQEVASILRLETELVTTAIKLLGVIGDDSVKLAAFFKAAMEKEKMMGKTNIKQLLQKVVNEEGQLMFFQFDENRLKDFSNVAKKYGLLYSVVQDRNKYDGLKEIIFHSSHQPQLEKIMQELKIGRIISEEEYLRGGAKTDNMDKKKETSKSKKSWKNTTKDKDVMTQETSIVAKLRKYDKENITQSTAAPKKTLKKG